MPKPTTVPLKVTCGGGSAGLCSALLLITDIFAYLFSVITYLWLIPLIWMGGEGELPVRSRSSAAGSVWLLCPFSVDQYLSSNSSTQTLWSCRQQARLGVHLTLPTGKFITNELMPSPTAAYHCPIRQLGERALHVFDGLRRHQKGRGGILITAVAIEGRGLHSLKRMYFRMSPKVMTPRSLPSLSSTNKRCNLLLRIVSRTTKRVSSKVHV